MWTTEPPAKSLTPHTWRNPFGDQTRGQAVVAGIEPCIGSQEPSPLPPGGGGPGPGLLEPWKGDRGQLSLRDQFPPWGGGAKRFVWGVVSRCVRKILNRHHLVDWGCVRTVTPACPMGDERVDDHHVEDDANTPVGLGGTQNGGNVYLSSFLQIHHPFQLPVPPWHPRTQSPLPPPTQ